MTFTIVATGETSQNWTPNGYSIGVNDAGKFGKPLDALLICNRPQTFPADRLNIIKNTKVKDFYAHKADWAPWFPQWKKIRLHQWNRTLHDFKPSDGPHGYSSDSSPIIAITLAYNLGATEIILWGADFRNHHSFNDKNPQTKREVRVYLEVFEQLKERGVHAWLGANGSVFDDHLPLYNQIKFGTPPGKQKENLAA